MTRLTQNGDDEFAVTVEIKVDRICTAFDRALRHGENPRVEDLLDGFEGEARDKLLASLLALEMEHRLAHGAQLPWCEYRERFPDDTQIVKSVYVETVMPTHIGHFQVEKILGKGGFGRVYLAYDDTLKRHVAIKMLFSRGGRSDARIQALLHEARLAARLKHAAIVPVYEVGQDEDGDHFVVLEYVEGTTLGDARREYGLSELQVLGILISVADALQYAHEQGLTHRDLKPANILVDQKHRPFITDFGLAVDESMQQLRAGEVAGTPPYMAPEQVAGETHRVDGRTDIWAFGVIFYELLTGSRPFGGDSRDELFYQIRHHDPKPPRQRDGTIPIRLERIVMTCLAKRMADRYRSAADLASALRIAYREFDSDRRRVFSDVEDPSEPSRDKSPTPAHARVVPKGIRSFERQDAAAFVRLLPGPRDSNGLPESIRFWQERINETDEDATFSIGLVYGPSGCGKSSFVKAGLLPRLADHVVPIFIEATSDETELRLLKAIRKLFGDVPVDLSLPDIVAGIREGRWVVAGKKVLIVLDQFEQWLHANTVQIASQLTDALRQCDGGRVQTIILVRDDFWMQVTRLLHVLEVPLLEGRNSAAVDLFDPRHAAAVLGEFGVAYGKLPAAADDWSDAQRRFVESASSSLAVDGRVVPVRLALFVEMIKLQPWTAETLMVLGGAEGTGVAFLEETFHGRTAAPERRLYREATRAVLECLLPPEGVDIRGNMQSERELLKCSGYVDSPDDFERLVTILDSELRLITPTDPAGQSREADDSPPVTSAERYYQLTHDYLVPAIRTWLTRSKRNTARGRAQLRLSERAAAYRSQPHVRQLPSAREWISILALTKRQHYKENERQLMRAATRHYLRRLGTAAIVVFLATWVAIEANGRLRAAGFVRSLATAETADVPQLVHDISPLRRWIDPQLHQKYSNGSDKERLHAAMALLPVDDSPLSYLVEQLVIADADSVDPIRETIDSYGDRDAATQALWKTLEEPNGLPARKLRAAIGLAQLGSHSDQKWQSVSGEVFEAWVDDVVANPRNFDRWLQMLRPIHEVMEQPALDAFVAKDQGAQTRFIVAAILAGLRADQPERLVDLVVEADRDQFRPLEAALLRHPHVAIPSLQRILKQPLSADRSEEEKDTVTSRQANAAISLFELGQPEALADALASVKDGDRRMQTWMVARFSRAAASESTLRSHLEGALALLHNHANGGSTNSDEIAFASALIVGNFAEQPWCHDYTKSAVDLLARLFQSHPDSGVHSAAEWALRKWEGDEAVNRLRETLCGKPAIEDGGWYVDSACHTMAIVNDPGKFAIGSPSDEPGRETDEVLRTVEIPYSYCVSTMEITQADFCRLVPELSDRFPNDFSLDAESPANDVTLVDAMKYCRRLSESIGVPEEEMCYPPVDKMDSSLVPDVARTSKTGYRLLTNSEWEYVCRAGSSTPRFYGWAPSLLDEYAWYVSNSGGQAHPVGRLKPNRFGMFDIHGNVREWTIYPTALLAKKATERGGPYSASARMLRSANWRADKTDFRGYPNGFRIARTRPSKVMAEHAGQVGSEMAQWNQLQTLLK